MSQVNPAEQQRHFSDLYSSMGEIELLTLKDSFNDLTETAQHVLREELMKRGLWHGQTQSLHEESVSSANSNSNDQSFSFFDLAQGGIPVYDCETAEQGGLIRYLFELAHIQSIYLPSRGNMSLRSAQILVAPSDVEKAQTILMEPISDEVRRDYEAWQQAGDFEEPSCSRCSSLDVVLESTEPDNQWLCEVCGHRWHDSTPDADSDV